MNSFAITNYYSKNLEYSDIASLSAQFRSYPLLTKEHELQLAQQFHEQDDQDAAQQLILSNMRYVIRVAKGYLGYGLPAKDLVQEGCIGLMKAVRNYNPSNDVRLLTYAIYWIKSAIQEFVIKNWRLVKVATTKAQRKLFFNIRKLRKKIENLSRNEIKATADILDVPVREVEVMEQRILYANELSVDSTPHDDNFQPLQIEDNTSNPEHLYEQYSDKVNYEAALSQAVKKLDKREQEIMRARWLTDKKIPFRELAKHYNLSIERVRQIEERAINKIKAYISKLNSSGLRNS